MSVESWARRASGLLVPTFGVTAPWRWLGCFGCSCQDCSGCGDSISPGVWVDLPALADGECIACSLLESSVYLSQRLNNCTRYYKAFSAICAPAGYGNNLFAYYAFNESPYLGKCSLWVRLEIVVSGGPQVYTYWATQLDTPASPIDHVLSNISSGPICDATGTTVHVYQ